MIDRLIREILPLQEEYFRRCNNLKLDETQRRYYQGRARSYALVIERLRALEKEEVER